MRLLQTFLLIATFFVGSVSAQKEISEVYIKMEITDVKSDNQEMAQMLEMMKGTETEVFYKDGRSLTKVNMMGGMVNIKNVVDKEGNTNMYMDAMGNKMHVESSKLEADRLKAESPNPMGDLEFEYDKSDTKTIAGYECYKMTAKSKGDTGGLELSGYITEDIKINASVIQGVDMADFPGFPLEYNLNMGGQMNLIVTTVELKDNVDSGVFKINDSGYKKMTMEEFMGAMGGMGGLGF